MAKQTKQDSTGADAMASALFSSFTQPPAPTPAAASASAPASPAPSRPAAVAPPEPAGVPAQTAESATVVASASGRRTHAPPPGRAEIPRRNRAAPEAKRRRETVILSEAERRPIVAVAEHMAATKPGASFSEAARFLLALGEHVLAAQPDAYARLERTPPAGWASLARELANRATK